MRADSSSQNKLKHLCPETHSEAQFAELINSIPKSKREHAKQAEHIKKLVEKENWRVRSILDVGAGEGTFTRLVLDLLNESGACDSEVQIDVIEKEETLWTKCEATLKAAGACPRRLRVDWREGSRWEMPNDREALLAFADRLKDAGTSYNLIIGSHITYYFDNAGAELAYALGSRLLNQGGRAWFVVRDRHCPFYRFRDELLATSRLPDVHRDCFSDSFLDRLRCLVEDSGSSDLRPIHTQNRKLRLRFDSKSDPKPLAEYLLWLSGLSNDQAKQASREGGKPGGFSETHVWFSRISKIDQHESDILAGIQIVGRCIDVVRRVAPDVETHRVSLATVEPEGYMPQVQAVAAVDIEKPIIISNFTLWSVGYACELGTAALSDPLNEFFKTNTSFLFYRRFYHDYRVAGHRTQAQAVDYSVVEQLTGRPKHVSPADYERRSVKSGERTAPLLGHTPLFSESVREWVSLLSRCYCDTKRKPDRVLMWSVCIGCNIVPDHRDVISKDHALNTCCAVFMTVSTKSNLKNLAPHFVGQIKARLAQWIAESIYERLHDQMEALEKQAQMLALLQTPVSGISDALAQMQSQTQEIRAVLYDPAKALFASHRLLSGLFAEHGILDASRHVRIRLSHRGNYDGTDAAAISGSMMDGQVVLAVALCRIFGRAAELAEQPTKRLIVEHAKAILVDCETAKAQSFGQLIDDLCWLLQLESEGAAGQVTESVNSAEGVSFASPGQRSRLTPRLAQLLNGSATMPLGILKNVLFQPFKLETKKWSVDAIALAVRAYLVEGSALKHKPRLGLLCEHLEIPFDETPCPFHAVLAFLTDVCAALYEDGTRVNEINVTAEAPHYTIRLTLSENWLDSEGCVKLASLIHEYVFSAPRDWRIQATNAGNFRKPFLDFAGHLLGVSGEPASPWKPCSKRESGRFAFLEVRRSVGHRLFRVRAEPKQSSMKLPKGSQVTRIAADLVLEWIPIGKGKSAASQRHDATGVTGQLRRRIEMKRAKGENVSARQLQTGIAQQNRKSNRK